MADYFIVEIRVSYIVRKLFAVSEKNCNFVIADRLADHAGRMRVHTESTPYKV